MTRALLRRLAATALLASGLSACSGIKTYTPSGDNNLRFNTVTDSGSAFSSMRAAVHIHSVTGPCKTAYQGTIDLNGPRVVSGIPAGRLSHLVFNFSGSSFFSNSRSSINYRTVLMPRRGHNYVFDVRYIDDMYDVNVHEVNKRRRTRKQMAQRRLTGCATG